MCKPTMRTIRNNGGNLTSKVRSKFDFNGLLFSSSKGNNKPNNKHVHMKYLNKDLTISRYEIIVENVSLKRKYTHTFMYLIYNLMFHINFSFNINNLENYFFDILFKN